MYGTTIDNFILIWTFMLYGLGSEQNYDVVK